MFKKNLWFIVLIFNLFLLFGCSGSGSGGNTVITQSPIIIDRLPESAITVVMGNNISNFKASPTQYLKITLTNIPSNNTYYLHYKSQKLGEVLNYDLCTTVGKSTSCVGGIGIRDLPVYSSGDSFNISNIKVSLFSDIKSQSAALLINPVNDAVSIDSDKKAWYTYLCGLTSKPEAPPAPKCIEPTFSTNNLGVTNSCPIKNNSIIAKSVIGLYGFNKYGDGKYGLSCTGIPIGDNWVLTAGHCIGSGKGFYGPVSNMYIVDTQSSQLPIEIESTTTSVQLISIESQYILKVAGDNSYCKNCQYYADFALLKVKNYTFINQIPLVDHSLILNKYSQVWIAGYGMHNSPVLGVIRDGQLNYRDSYYDHIDDANPGVLYSIGSIPNKNDYSWKFDGNGDSGGPLFIINPVDGKLYLLSTLTGGTYFDAASIHCKSAGVMVENASMIYWGDTIKSIMNGMADPATYITN